MLDFIPMNSTATLYKQGKIDNWGRPVLDNQITSKCFINYNTNLTKISGEDGVTSSMSATVLFKRFVPAEEGDFVEFTTDLSITNKYQVIDVFFFKDYGGKVIATRVVIGNGKRV